MALRTIAPTYPHLAASGEQYQGNNGCGAVKTSCNLNHGRQYKRQQQKQQGASRVCTPGSIFHRFEDLAAQVGHEINISLLERLFEIPPPPSSPSPRTPIRIAYQGAPGSYCHEAVSNLFPTTDFTLPCSQMEDAFSFLESGAADRAVIPFENSLDGPIPRNLDLLLRHPDVAITGEVLLPVNHCLLSAGTDSIRKIVSHPQALSHCEGRLQQIGVAVDEVPCAAEAARLLAGGEIPADTAVIASRAAAREFGLRILGENLQDPAPSGNVTRFLQLALGRTGPANLRRKKVKATVAFGLERGPSDLFQAMWMFESRGLKVIRVDHRPNRVRPVRCVGEEGRVCLDCVFVLDVEGDQVDVAAALDALGEIAAGGSARLLGSYDVPSSGRRRL